MAILSKYHVCAGAFEAGKRQPRLLQAFLGTCVAVALVDETAGIGGLIHLLLPEPPGPWTVDQPDKYATTGMPRFIQAIEDLGARRSNLRAMVAGGALVGPLTQQDINLDIGGRTTERVLESLAANGIEVVSSETGGFFTCCIELDMQSWSCVIKPVGFDAGRSQPVAPSPSADEIQQAIAAVRPVPQVALKVLRILDNEDYDTGRLADEVKKDQVISARTIQLCNSAMFAKRRDVASLDHALVFLGRELFLKLVISAAVKSYYDQTGNGYSLCKGGLYHHAVGTALVAERLAVVTGNAVPAVAYTAGLLHDIGKVVLDQYIVGAYPLFYRQFQHRQGELIDVEQHILGMDHTRIGGTLAQTWALPDTLGEAIRFHHRPEQSRRHAVLTTIIYLADLLMSRFHAGLELERMDTGKLMEHLDRLGLSTAQFGELVDQMPKTVFEPAAATVGNGA